MTVAEHKAGLSDEAMHAATGRHPDEWFAILAAEPSSVNPGAKHPTARWKTPDGETILATISPTRNARTSITLTHSRISDPERVGEAKATLASVLKTLVKMLD